MANHKSSEKRIRSTKSRQILNKFQAKTVRNAIKKARTASEQEDLTKKLPEIVSMVDKLAKKNVIHKNKAANIKSKLMKKASAVTVKEKTA